MRSYDFVKTNLLVIGSAIVFLTLGGYVQHKGFELGVVVTEYLIVMLPVFVAGWLMKVDFKSALRLNPIKLKTAVKIMGLALTALPTIYFLNFMVVMLLVKLDRFYQVNIPMPKSASELGVSLLLIAFSAGLCEELMFRGMLMNAYERKFGRFWAIICPALIFGMFHFNPMNFFGPVVLGIIFGYLVLSTNSIYASMIAHMTNNGFAVLLAFTANMNPAASAASSESPAAALEKLMSSPAMMVTTILVLLVFALIMAVPGFFLFRSIRQDRLPLAVGEVYRIMGENFEVEEVLESQLIVRKMDESNEKFTMESSKLASYKPIRITPFTVASERKRPEWKAFAPVMVFLSMYVVIGIFILERAAGK